MRAECAACVKTGTAQRKQRLERGRDEGRKRDFAGSFCAGRHLRPDGTPGAGVSGTAPVHTKTLRSSARAWRPILQDGSMPGRIGAGSGLRLAGEDARPSSWTGLECCGWKPDEAAQYLLRPPWTPCL